MSRITYLHVPKNRHNLINCYYIALIPLLIFGFYKNGILLYNNDLIKFIEILTPIYFYIISIITAIIFSFITKTNLKETILICLITSATISINTNKLFYPILLFILLFISSFIKTKTKKDFNSISIIRIFLILSLLLNAYSYLNIGEKLNDFNYNYFDIFKGYCTGGIATSSGITMLISFSILLTNKFYKKQIAFSSSLTYIILTLIYIFISHNYDFLTTLLNGTIYFGFIFIAPDLYTTPYNYKGMIIYGILIGILSTILSIIINIYEASYISIFLISLLIPIINKVTSKKYLHQ